MQPAEFIDALNRHYSKRHASPEDQAAWLREMVGLVRGFDQRVLARAYTMIRDHHEERAFPLPATILRHANQAAEALSFAGRSQAKPVEDLPLPTPEARERVRKIKEAAVAAMRARKPMETPVELDWSRTQREGFEEMQRNSPNRHLHVDHSALMRRITGERD
jgi:hypothetical protein